MRLFDLTGKVALVTGGTAGIGLGMARGLRDAGARVVLAGRDQARGEAAAATLGGDDVLFVRADVTLREDCLGAVGAAVARFGRLDTLVNNAGTTGIRKTPETLELSEWRSVLDTNLTSALLCSQAAHGAMRRAGGGKIIMVGSLMSWFGAPYAAAYGASKGGIVQLGRALATAWAADGIQVNSILPGWIETEMTAGARSFTPGLADAVVARSPAGRWGTPDDLAGVAVFLASAASDFVTGASIAVDGGYSVRA